MLLGANATVDYLAVRVHAETPFTATVQTFVVANAMLTGPPSVNLTLPTSQEFQYQVDFSVRQGSGVVTGQIVYLPDGGCGLPDLTGKIALLDASDKSCGYMKSFKLNL